MNLVFFFWHFHQIHHFFQHFQHLFQLLLNHSATIPSMWPLAQRWPNFACSGGDLRPSPCFWTPRWRTKRCARIYCNQYLTNMQWWCKNDDHMNFQDIFQDCMILAWYLYDTCMILVWYLYDTCMILVWLYPQSMPCFFSETLDQELDLEQSREAPWGAENGVPFC